MIFRRWYPEENLEQAPQQQDWWRIATPQTVDIFKGTTVDPLGHPSFIAVHLGLHVDMRKGDTSRSLKKRLMEYEDGRNVDGEVGSYGMLKDLLAELQEKGIDYASWSPQALATTALQVREWVEGHSPGGKVWPPATPDSNEQVKSLARRKEFWRAARQMDRIRREVHERQASDNFILFVTSPKEDLDPFREISQ